MFVRFKTSLSYKNLLECLFELRLLRDENNGRVLVYDAAQIPNSSQKTAGIKTQSIGLCTTQKKDQFLIINSADKRLVMLLINSLLIYLLKE
jgi:hypothetical protein